MELMTTLVVVGVLTGYAVPGFRGLIDQARYNQSSDTLIDALSIARNEAIFNGKQVIVCATDDPAATQPVCSASQADWNNGWLIYQRCDNNLVRETVALICDLDGIGPPEAIEPVIKTFEPSDFDIQIDTNAPITFLPSGMALTNTLSAITRFTITSNGDTGTVTVNSLARIESSPVFE